MSRRAWRLQDFIAHSGKVQCARLGEKSGQVLATGGDDKRVNIWRVGKPNAMMSLTGHTSAAECLVFDKQEEVLVVGCASGTIQVWNLEYRKMAGTLTGHRAGCAAVEFHPYGEFFASGSADTNLKIWDLRRKSCIQTYKGHTGSVSSIRFSPHGRWVATGGLDGQVKLWDLTAGKLMRDLDLHKGAITSVAFHPKEYLLATGSADRTMKLWSLETFRPLGTTELGSSPVQAVKFYVEEQAVLNASQDALRVFSTESLAAPVDTIEVDWRGLQDMRLHSHEEKLIAVTAEGPQLGIWVADLQKREQTSAKAAAGGYGRLHARAGPSSNQPRPPVQAQRRVERPVSSVGSAGSEDDADASDPPSLEARSVSGPIMSGRPPGQEQAARSGSAPLPPGRPHGVHGAQEAPFRGGYSPTAYVPSARSQAPDRLDGGPRGQLEEPLVGVAGMAVQDPDSDDPEPPVYPSGPSAVPPVSRLAGPLEGRSPPLAGPRDGSRSPSDVRGIAGVAPAASSKVSVEQISQLSSQHLQMAGVLQRRLDQARRLKELWARGNITALTSMLTMPQDQAVFCDFARAIMRRRLEPALNLDTCLTLLPILRGLVGSKYSDFAEVALRFVQVLLDHFGGIIAETRQSCSGVPERHLDLPREERLKKCNGCFEHFREIRDLLADSPLAARFSGLRSALHAFLLRC